MIDFACKKFDIDEIIKCALGLSKGELRMLRKLMTLGVGVDSSELAKSLNLDISTVQRGVKKLRELGVISRTQKNLENGGYVYVYRALSKKRVREIVMGVIDNWVDEVEKKICEF